MGLNRRVVLQGLSAGIAGVASGAGAQELSFKGKQIRLMVGAAIGGGYDGSARLVARHIGRYIPGNPTIVVENMPGAGSVIMLNTLYNNVPKDGTVWGGTNGHGSP